MQIGLFREILATSAHCFCAKHLRDGQLRIYAASVLWDSRIPGPLANAARSQRAESPGKEPQNLWHQTRSQSSFRELDIWSGKE